VSAGDAPSVTFANNYSEVELRFTASDSHLTVRRRAMRWIWRSFVPACKRPFGPRRAPTV